MASWLRSKLQGRANPLVLSQLSDEELVRRYLRGKEEESTTDAEARGKVGVEETRAR